MDSNINLRALSAKELITNNGGCCGWLSVFYSGLAKKYSDYAQGLIDGWNEGGIQ